jgi:hypothetical protein
MKNNLLLLLILFSYSAFSVIVPSDSSDLKITIYNDNRAFINDTRSVQIKKGKQKLIYESVPSSVIAQSVVPTFSGTNVQLYSQNYNYGVVSLNAMLINSIGKSVQYYTNGENPRLKTGKLLTTNPVMIKAKRGIFTLNNPSQVVFNSVPDTMLTKPSLIWNIDSTESNQLAIDLKYLTRDVSWSSDYVLNLTKKSFNLKGWASVKNNSGVPYKNAKITLVAGKLNQAPTQYSRSRMHQKNKNFMMEAVFASPTLKSEGFSGYHLYEIPFKETIENQQTKQIAFIDKTQIPYQQYGIYNNHYFENYGTQKLTFRNMLTFKNSKSNQLGITLPKGIVRMYKKSANGQTHFIGESNISDTPKDEIVKLTIGVLFDATGEKKITQFVSNKHYKAVETTYTLNNRGKTPLVLKIKENIPKYGARIKLKNTCNKNCSVKKLDAFIQEFSVKLAPETSYNFTTEFEINF